MFKFLKNFFGISEPEAPTLDDIAKSFGFGGEDLQYLTGSTLKVFMDAVALRREQYRRGVAAGLRECHQVLNTEIAGLSIKPAEGYENVETPKYSENENDATVMNYPARIDIARGLYKPGYLAYQIKEAQEYLDRVCGVVLAKPVYHIALVDDSVHEKTTLILRVDFLRQTDSSGRIN